jgi:type VI secretion system protein ImpH
MSTPDRSSAPGARLDPQSDPLADWDKPPPSAEAILADLLEAVEADASRVDFYALMRRIDSLRQQYPRTGEALRPSQEVLRLGQAPELDFAAAPLHSLERRADFPPRLAVRFFGMLGPQGALPLHLTEFVRERARHHDDSTLAHFLDLFHHRMLSFFYRAWAQAQPVVQLDRPEQDRFRVWLAALAGAASAGRALSPQLLAYQTGWLGARSAHPERLVKVLGQYLDAPIRLEELVGQWLSIDSADRTQLGYPRNHAARSQRPGGRLGRDANAGSRVWDRQYRYRLCIGPLTLARYEALLPGGADWAALRALVELHGGRDKQWDLQLTLHNDARPTPSLGGVSRLGLSCWLGDAAAVARRQLRVRPLTSFLNRRPLVRPGAPDA